MAPRGRRHPDPELREVTQYPWVVLRTVSTDKIKSPLARYVHREK
jgi:hypothetical protein